MKRGHGECPGEEDQTPFRPTGAIATISAKRVREIDSFRPPNSDAGGGGKLMVKVFKIVSLPPGAAVRVVGMVRTAKTNRIRLNL